MTGMSRHVLSALSVTEHLVAVHLRHHHVKQYKINRLRLEQRQSVLPVLRRADIVAFML